MAANTGEAFLGNWSINILQDSPRYPDGRLVEVSVVSLGRIYVVGGGAYALDANGNGIPALFSGIQNLSIIAHDQPPSVDPLISIPGFIQRTRYAYYPEHNIILSNMDGSTLSGTITVETGYGNDSLDGSAVSNVIVARGGPDNDRLFGGSNDDFLQGDDNDDILVGNGGYDTAVWAYPRPEYSVHVYPDNGALKAVVEHKGGSNVDGTDTLASIEALRFSDHTFGLISGQLNHNSNVDGDRFDDVLFQNATTGQVYFSKMIDGVFQSWGVDTDALGTDWKVMGSGDVNPGPTGGAETFVQQQSTSAIYYASLDTGSTTWGVVDTPGADWKLRAVADMNGDTAADAVVQSTTTGAIKYAAMFNGSFAGYDLVNQHLTTDWLLVGAGDINRDGLADAVIQQQSTGTAYYAVMASGAFQYWDVISQNLTPEWRVRAVADLTGDGFADVVVQSQSTGTAYYADMAGGNFAGWGVVAQNTGPTWMVEGTADVDNDGCADVLFQNQSNGTTYYAAMGPAGFESWGVVAIHVGPEWQVV